MKKKVLATVGILLVIVSLCLRLNTDTFYEKRNRYSNHYVFGGGNNEDLRKANYYSALEKFSKDGAEPCVFFGGVLFVVSFLIKDKKDQKTQ